MSVLFQPVKIKNMEVPNRFVRSATGDRAADKDGYVTPEQIAILSEVAEGGAGLIVTGVVFVHPSGQRLSHQNSLANDRYIPGLKGLTAAVHKRGAKIAAQLFHGGREAAPFQNSLGKDALAPSFIGDDPHYTGKHRSMTEPEIWEIIRSFGDAARRAREAGFDAIQVHGAHAYLLSQFLSPFTNRRTDGWGGKLEDRLRFYREIYRDIRKKVGDDYPVIIKVGVVDGFEGGLTPDEGLKAAKWMAEWGFDALEVSQGLRGKSYEESEFRTQIDSLEREGYFRDMSRQVKRQVNVPVMMVGGLRTFELMEEVIEKGEADFISLSRPLIREPAIINDWRKGDRRRSICISCNKCLESLRKGDGLHCVFRKKEGKPTGKSSP